MGIGRAAGLPAAGRSRDALRTGCGRQSTPQRIPDQVSPTRDAGAQGKGCHQNGQQQEAA